mmetsp:Transcript_46768/g.124128  ORF Transcript_46768/g.124128 Transcript_46768/m.124128 type:complete len:207 (+) Transcript_46768:45-665(+)
MRHATEALPTPQRQKARNKEGRKMLVFCQLYTKTAFHSVSSRNLQHCEGYLRQELEVHVLHQHRLGALVMCIQLFGCRWLGAVRQPFPTIHHRIMKCTDQRHGAVVVRWIAVAQIARVVNPLWRLHTSICHSSEDHANNWKGQPQRKRSWWYVVPLATGIPAVPLQSRLSLLRRLSGPSFLPGLLSALLDCHGSKLQVLIVQGPLP